MKKNNRLALVLLAVSVLFLLLALGVLFLLPAAIRRALAPAGAAPGAGATPLIRVVVDRAQNLVTRGAGFTQTTITGTVFDEQGKPAPEVAVKCFPFSPAEGLTDANGRFTLTMNTPRFNGPMTPQRAVIARDLAQNRAAAVDLDDDATNATLKLAPALTLAGRVTDTKDNVLPEARVTVVFMTERMEMPLGMPTEVDREGRYEIKGLPQGRRYAVQVSAPGFGSDFRQVDAADANAPRVDLEPFELPLADQSLAGVVLDENGKPVANARVNTYGPRQVNVNGTTDAQGRFSFGKVCAGPISLQAMLDTPGGNPAAFQPQAFGHATSVGGDTNITIRLRAQPNLGRPMTPVKITGTVVDPKGKPARNALVTLFPFSQTQRHTDDNGHFTLTQFGFGGTQPNQRTVVARDFARNLAAAVDLEDPTAKVNLKLGPALTLVGRATDSSGHALTNAQAQVILRTDRMGSFLGSAVPADVEGNFEIKALPLGRTYSVVVTAKGFGQDQREVEPPEDGSGRLELGPFELLVADQRIAGVVLDTAERPVVSAFVNTGGEKQPNLHVQTDGKGRFAFAQVCAGTLRLFANDPNGLGLFGQATVEAGDTNITLQLAPPRMGGGGRRPAFQPVSLKGKPLPGLAPFGLSPADAPMDQPVLAVLVDTKRSSSRLLRSLGDQAEALKQQGVAVVVLQTSPLSGDAFDAWKQQADLPFPTGFARNNVEQTRAAWGAGSLPWLILADRTHQVIDEGFVLEELEAKLPAVTK